MAMPIRIRIERRTKRALQVYGFGSFTGFTGLTALAPLLMPGFMYVAAGGAVVGGAAGLLGYFAVERRDRQPTLVFVSTGGTCRDPMAKVIMEALLAGRQPSVRIYATALRVNPEKRASKAARYIVKEEMGQDLLSDHRPHVLDETIISAADLVLTMDEAHANAIRKNFPEAAPRIHNLRGFLGEPGDVEDPWRAPDEMDFDTLARYRACFRSLRTILEKNADRIYSAVIA
jgi:protein-tyrosine-phosphatase